MSLGEMRAITVEEFLAQPGDPHDVKVSFCVSWYVSIQDSSDHGPGFRTFDTRAEANKFAAQLRRQLSDDEIKWWQNNPRPGAYGRKRLARLLRHLADQADPR